MKKILLLVLGMLGLTGLKAQEDQTLFKGVEIVGGFGGPLVQFTSGNDDFGVLVGGGGGIILNQFFIGGFGMGNSDFVNVQQGNLKRDIGLGYGGLWIGHSPQSWRLLHPFYSLKIAGGGVGYNWDFDDNSGFNFDRDTDAIFVLEPEAGVELNIAEFFRIALTANYRWVRDVDQIDELDNDDLSAFGANLTMRFGFFNKEN